MIRKMGIFVTIAPILLAFAMLVTAGELLYSYITSADLKARIQSGESTAILDIQTLDEFSRHHIRGAVPTYAYPVKSEEERSRIEAVYTDLASASGSVVIVCPRGGGGARRTYDYLVSRGIVEERLFILEKGQEGWPYPELLEGTVGPER